MTRRQPPQQLPLLSGEDTVRLLNALETAYRALRDTQPLLNSVDSLVGLRKRVKTAVEESRIAIEVVTGRTPK